MSIEKLKEYFEIFTACWKFFRKYMELILEANSREQKTMDDESYWEAFVNESTEIYARYGNTEFVKGVLVAATKEIERIYQEERRGNEASDKR